MKKLIELNLKIVGCPLWVEVEGEDDLEINHRAKRVEGELSILLEAFYGTMRKP